MRVRFEVMGLKFVVYFFDVDIEFDEGRLRVKVRNKKNVEKVLRNLYYYESFLSFWLVYGLSYLIKWKR